MKSLSSLLAAESRDADLWIAASGYESRCTFASEHVAPQGAKLALAFEGTTGNVRSRSDKVFSQLSFRSELVKPDDARAVRQIVLTYVRSANARSLAVDFSSMTRAWMWGLISEAWELLARNEIDTLDLLYSPARFAPPPLELPPPTSIGPVPGVSSLIQVPSDRLALVVGLGYEADRALGLLEYFDPSAATFFYADPGSAEDYLASVKRANHSLFHSISVDNLVPYDLSDWVATASKLEGVMKYFRQEHRVLCIPMGPKPFAAIAAVVALELGDIALWRVSNSGLENGLDRMPRGDVMAVRIRQLPG